MPDLDMAPLVIYFNPHCSKCRFALQSLESAQVPSEVVRYLERPLDRSQLTRLVDQLEDAPADLVRRDRKFAELGLNPKDYQSKQEVVSLLLEHPELMQRPVIVRDCSAAIARAPEVVAQYLPQSISS